MRFSSPPATETDATALAALAAHEADATGVHGISYTAEQVPAKIFQPRTMTTAVAATTANIALSGLQTIDGVSVGASDVVLVKDQTDETENGLYNAAAGAWSRSTVADWHTSEITRAVVHVVGGTTNIDKVFAVANLTAPTIGTDDITWAEIGNAGAAVDLTPANRMAVDLATLVYGNWGNTGTVQLANLEVSTSMIFPALAALYVTWPTSASMLVADETVPSPGGADTVMFYDSASGSTLYILGDGLQTDASMPITVTPGGTAGNSYLKVAGGQASKVVNKTANYTIVVGDHTIAYTTLAAARTATLPALSAVPDGWECLVCDATTGTHADTYNITVQRAGSDLFVTGGTNTIINTANGYRRIKKVNNRWMVVGSA